MYNAVIMSLPHRYLDDFEKRIPREEVVRIEAFIKKEIKKLDPQYLVTVCGSYRYGTPVIVIYIYGTFFSLLLLGYPLF